MMLSRHHSRDYLFMNNQVSDKEMERKRRKINKMI
jgi:hypothetical protein